MSGATDAAAKAVGTMGSTADSPGTEDQPAAGEPAPGSGRGTAEVGGAKQGGPTQGRTTVTDADAQGARPAQPHHPPQAYAPSVPAAVPAPGRGPGQGRQEPKPGRQGPQGRQGAPGAPQGQLNQPQAVRQPRPAAHPAPRTRKARLRVAKADPWSVMKVSFVLSIALGLSAIVAVTVLWTVLDALGVFSTVGSTIADATGSGQQSGFDLKSFLSLSNVVLFTTLIAVIDVVLATALATLGAFLYNLTVGFVGGVELTLAEDE